jgi:probable F420-dependent oxidoreductase
MTRPFRFGVQLSKLDRKHWVEEVQTIESLGFSSVFCPDHFSSQWDPTALLGAASAVTEKLRVGTLVYDVDFRHPIVFAKQAATLQLLSGGRHEFGIGAGWMESDYLQAGIAYDRPGLRIERLEEAIQIAKSMWSQEETTFEGKHYQLKAVPMAAHGIQKVDPPKILIGGGGRRLLRLAGRHADIVGINPQLHEGRVTADTPADLAPERVREKVGWVREGAEAAGRDPAAIELNSLSFVVAVTDDPKGLRAGIAQNTGMTVEQVADCPLFLTGSPAEIRERLEKRREETGISYVVIQGRKRSELEPFAEAVVEPLAGR